MPWLGAPPADVALSSSDIADDAITLAKLAGGTDGNLITYDASGDPAAVAVGTAGHFLKSQGAGSVPVFAAAGGTTEVIQTQVAAGASTVDFTTGTFTDYAVLLIYGAYIQGSTSNAALRARISDDAGSSFEAGTNDYEYSVSELAGNGTETHAGGTTGVAFGTLMVESSLGGLSTPAHNGHYSFQGMITGHAAGTYTTMRFSAGHWHQDDSDPRHFEGSWTYVVGTAESDGVQFLASAGNLTGRFTLYGLKHA